MRCCSWTRISARECCRSRSGYCRSSTRSPVITGLSTSRGKEHGRWRREFVTEKTLETVLVLGSAELQELPFPVGGLEDLPNSVDSVGSETPPGSVRY